MKYFFPFRFDDRSGVLSRGGDVVPLTRKAADLLHCLLGHPGRLVTHHQLARHVWPDTHVQPENLKALVHELRNALGDDSHAPHFIRSESGRGYVFTASVTDAMVPLLSDIATWRPSPLVARAAELAAVLKQLNDAAVHGVPRLVTIESERGLGKTALCEAFVRAAIGRDAARLTYAQGLETSGPLEEYGVLIDALDLLGRQYVDLVPATLARRAPYWFARLDRRADDPRADEPAGEPGGERAARELGAALDDIAAEVPLIIVLDDMQWADPASITCLRVLARRHVRARLCILMTYCASADAPAIEPLQRLDRELLGRSSGAAIALQPLSSEDLRRCLEQRVGGAAGVLTPALFAAGGGNPWFALQVVSSLIRLGALYETATGWQLAETAGGIDAVIGSSLADTLKDQVDRLSATDRSILDAGAAVGIEFGPAAIAAHLDLDHDHVGVIDRRLQWLAARHLLVDGVEPRRKTPPSSRYRFRHPCLPALLGHRTPMLRQLRLVDPAVRDLKLADRGS